MSGENIKALRPPLAVWIPEGVLVTPKEAKPNFAREGLKMRRGLNVVIVEGGREQSSTSFTLFIARHTCHNRDLNKV